MSHEAMNPPVLNSNNIASDDLNSIDKRIIEVRSRISDLGFEIDSEKTSAALAMGAGVFLILLAALACYDLLSGKAGIWLAVGITRDRLEWIAYGCGAAAAVLMIQAIARRIKRDRSRETELAELEQEHTRLLERKDSISKQ